MSPKLPPLSEHQEQANFFAEVSQRFASDDTFFPNLLFAVPNGAILGGKNRFAVYNHLLTEGFKKGVADIIYLQPRGPWPFMCIEMKRSDKKNTKDGALSPEQIEFMNSVEIAGGLYALCYGCAEAVEAFSQYMAFV